MLLQGIIIIVIIIIIIIRGVGRGGGVNKTWHEH